MQQAAPSGILASTRVGLDPATMRRTRTPGGPATRELMRTDTQEAHSFARSARSSNVGFHRRPYLPWSPPETSVVQRSGGSWPAPPEERTVTKLPFVPNDFQPVSRVAEARQQAASQCLRDLKRRKQSRLVAFRPRPMQRRTVFTEASGNGSGIGVGYSGGFYAQRACAGTSNVGGAGGSLGSLANL